MDVRSVLEFDNQSILISTLDHGMYRYFNDGKIEPFKTSADDFLKKNLIFASSKVNENCFAFGTFRGGLLLMSKKGNILKIINEESGIRENSIRAMLLDREGSLWLGLNNGISRVEINSPVTVFDKRKNIKGSVYQVSRNETTLYIGTSVGLNYINPKIKEVRSVDNFADQVWKLYSLPGEQLVGTNTSSYSLRDLKISFINNSGGSFTFLQSKKDKQRVFVGQRDGMQSLYKTNKGWQVENQYKEIKGQIKSIHEDKLGGIWINSSLLGLVHMNFGRGYTQPTYTFFSKKDGIPTDDKFKFISMEDEFFIFSKFTFYKYDSVSRKFIDADIQISGTLPDLKESFSLTSDNNNNQIVWSNSTVGYLKQISSKNYQWDQHFFLRIRDKAINYVFTDDDSLVWIGSANGLYRVDITKKNKSFEDFETQIRNISIIDSDSSIFTGMESKRPPLLDNHFNKLRFQFAASFFDQSDETEYQTFLEKSDDSWSSWSTNTKKDYTNLWEGKYTFHVRSKNIYNSIGKEAQYTFIILPPWYRTKVAYALYLFGLANLFYFGVRTYYNSLKRTNKRLEGLVEMRTSKINLQKEEIESQRDNLVQAHQTIEKQNSELLRMNHELEKIVEERTSALTNSNNELIEVNKELDRFVYRAAHDLRGPVATLLGLCNLSLMETKDQSAIEYLSKIQLTAERLNFLLFMLLKINRIKITEINSEPIDINNLINNIYTTLLENYKNRSDIKVTTRVDSEIEMHSDVAMVSIILENLIDNALKFTRPDVAPQINIDIRKNGKRVNIIITDNGIGIAEEYRSKIFDMFFIGTAERKGLGLGLHAVQMAVKKLHGSVRLMDGNTYATQFFVDIPERI
jgi:signal transduction histidine kinase